MKYLLSDKSNYFFLLSNLGVILLFTLSLTILKGYTYGAIVFYLPILLIPLWWKNKIIAPHYYKLSLVIIFSALTGILNAWLSNDAKLYETPVKYLLTTIILLYLVTYPPKPYVIWWSIAIGAIAAGLSAIYYNFDDNVLRVSKYLNPIHFGDYSILFAIICLCVLYSPKGLSKLLIVFLLLGSILGFSAAILSGSRGAWLSFIITISFLILINILDKKKLFKIGLPLLILLTSSILFFGKDRINLAINEVKNYQENKSSSVGLRLEMWKFGLSTGIKYPLFGASSKRMDQEKKLWIEEQGEESGALLKSDHLHNEFIDTFALKGIVGLSSVLLLFLYPLFVFLKSRKRINKGFSIDQLRLSNIAITHIVAFMGFSLTESIILRFNSAFILFMIPLCIFYAAYNKESQ